MTVIHKQNFIQCSGFSGCSIPQKNKLHPLSFRVNAKEKARIKSFADKRKQSVSQYVRAMALSGGNDPAHPPNQETDPAFKIEMAAKILGALGKSGALANLSTLADAAQAGALPVSEELEAELRDACALVLAIRNDLVRALGIKPQS